MLSPGGSKQEARFTETQIVSILKSADAGTRVSELCRQQGISETTYYKWKSKYDGMEASDLKRVKELEVRNAKLKRMCADLTLESMVMKVMFAASYQAWNAAAVSAWSVGSEKPLRVAMSVIDTGSRHFRPPSKCIRTSMNA